MIATNIRIPEEVRDRLKSWARSENRSMNDLTVEILDEATGRWAALKALDDAERVCEAIRTRHGVLDDSTPFIRKLREERSERV